MITNTRLIVLGCRGSIPVSGAEFAAHGGATTSFALVADHGVLGFIDAGTGIIAYPAHGLRLSSSVDILLTHYHWDHIQGLSMMREVWDGDSAVTIHGPGEPEPVLTTAIAPPLFPAAISDAPNVSFRTISPTIDLGGLTVTSFKVEHPQGAVGFRIDGPSTSVGIVTDHESGTSLDAAVVEAVRGVDVLFHDGQYLPEEAASVQGWGHSTWEEAVTTAEAAGVGEVILTSHDPRRTDREIVALVHAARYRFPATEAARVGMEIPL
ncbi:MAG: MBL fold metallo-hydrolase [Actinomycetota bacterium]